MLNDGKKHRGRGRPLTRGGGMGRLIITGTNPTFFEGQGKGLVPPGGEDH